MNNSLYEFQEKAVGGIVEFYASNLKNAKINLSTGVGIQTIVSHSIKRILCKYKKCKILLLCGGDTTVAQWIATIVTNFKYLNVVEILSDLKDNGIFITSYRGILTTTAEINYNNFDLIICDDLEFLDDRYLYPFFEDSYKGKRLSILRSNSKNTLTEKDKLIFKYNISNAINDGYAITKKEIDFLEDFFPVFLSQLGFEDIKLESKHRDYCIDMMATYDKKNYVFELKTYRSKNVSSSLIENAANVFSRIVQRLESTSLIPIMVVASKVDKQLKEEIFNETQIEVWDISNLLYLCSNSQNLMQKLSLYIPFPIFDIKLEEPIQYCKEKRIDTELKPKSQYEKFEKLLNQCKTGKIQNEDRKYEIICTKIIKYLFETEFFQMSTQHKTGDNLFRMDMICSLKGTTEFWKFLMQFFNTKFVIFEYKNYSEELPQNLIVITSKYLFPAALRNVAFIVSRYGLNKNAERIAISQIKDEKKLIVSLTDEDLLAMVALKEKGEEPSDYLLEKVENLLMSLSI